MVLEIGLFSAHLHEVFVKKAWPAREDTDIPAQRGKPHMAMANFVFSSTPALC